MLQRVTEKKQSHHKRGCFYHIRIFFYLPSKLTDLPQIIHRFVFYTQKQWLSQYGTQNKDYWFWDAADKRPRNVPSARRFVSLEH